MKINKKKLQQLYWEEGLSQAQIANHIGTTRDNVKCLMEKYEIPRREQKKLV